jgi:membrane-associated phospholipid phosphatase
MAMILAALASILISGMVPAMAMFVQLGLDPAVDFPNLDPAAAFVHVADLEGLRAGTLRVISLRHVEGIITFPSFHAALGVIFARAFWASRWTRWPGLALNGVLIAATPIDGGHYFVDVIAGVIIAGLAIAAARRLCGGATRAVAPIPVRTRIEAH